MSKQGQSKFQHRYQFSDRRFLEFPIEKIDTQEVMMCVSRYLYESLEEKNADSLFDEERYFSQHPEKFDEERIKIFKEEPTFGEIFEFIQALYMCAEYSYFEISFQPECCIYALDYIKRIETPLTASTWRPLTLVAIILANKFVHDHADFTNAEFCNAYDFFTIGELNCLEMDFFKQLNYSLNMSAEKYAEYVELLFGEEEQDTAEDLTSPDKQRIEKSNVGKDASSLIFSN